MLIEFIKSSITINLQKLKTEITSYKTPANIWKVEGNISNSAGNLCLHLLGNINHFICAALRNTGYVRNRDLEFSQKNIPVEVLAAQIDDTVGAVENTFDKMTTGKLDQDYPLVFNNQKLTTQQMLVNIISHLNYHLGQINYQRRLLDK